jgi:anti-sigma-K factor RskA
MRPSNFSVSICRWCESRKVVRFYNAKTVLPSPVLSRARGAGLAPLAEAAPAIEPPVDYLAAIEARIRTASSAAAPPPSAAAADSSAVALRRSVTRWRATAIAASVVAGALAIGIVARETTREPVPHEYVALLQKDAASPAFEVTVNLDTRELTVRPVAAQMPPGRSDELWIIDAKLGAPRSLGAIGETGRAASLSAYDPAVVDRQRPRLSFSLGARAPPGPVSRRVRERALSYKGSRTKFAGTACRAEATTAEPAVKGGLIALAT